MQENHKRKQTDDAATGDAGRRTGDTLAERPRGRRRWPGGRTPVASSHVLPERAHGNAATRWDARGQAATRAAQAGRRTSAHALGQRSRGRPAATSAWRLEAMAAVDGARGKKEIG